MISQVLGVLGAFLMANRYTNVYWYQVPTILIAALWRGKSAKDAAALVDLGGESEVAFLQGLGFVAVAFALQCVSLFL